MTASKASTLILWKIMSRRMPALFTTPSSRPKWSVAVLTILLAGMASATDSKLGTAVPPRFLISATTSSAGAADEPAPSEAPPGSLTTTLAPSAAHSSAISRPMPRPAPVTMMTLSCSDFAKASSRVVRASALVRKNDRARCGEHAADAVTDRNLRIRHLRRRNATHLPHALLQRIHAVHARMHIGQTAAIGVERQFPARPSVAVGDELAGFLIRHETEIAEAEQRQMREGVVDHQMIDVLVHDASFLEGQRTRDLEGARGVEGLHLADHRRFHALAGAEDIDRLARKILRAIRGGENQRAAAVGDEAALQQAERIGDHPRIEDVGDCDRVLHRSAGILPCPLALYHRDHGELLMGDAVGLHEPQHGNREHAGRPVDAERRLELSVQTVRRRRARLLADHRLAALGVRDQHGLAESRLDRGCGMTDMQHEGAAADRSAVDPGRRDAEIVGDLLRRLHR